MLEGKAEQRQFEIENAAEDPEFAAFLAGKGIKLDDAPVLDSAVRIYWDGFFTLSGDRPQHFEGPGRIPYAAMSQFCRDLEMDPAGIRVFTKLIRAMDDEFMAFNTEKRSQTPNGG